MSLKFSLIFVFGLSSVLVANGTPTETFLQVLPESSPDLHMILQVSEILYTAMAGNVLEENDENSIVPAWKSIITTLNSSKGAETFRVPSAQMKEMIKDDTVQQTLINIFATCFTYLAHAVGEGDSENIQLLWQELRNMISGNDKPVFPTMQNRFGKIMPDPGAREQFRIIGNSDEVTLDEVVQEIVSKEGSLRSGDPNVPEDFGKDFEIDDKKDLKIMMLDAENLHSKPMGQKQKENNDIARLRFLFNGENENGERGEINGYRYFNFFEKYSTIM